MFCTSKTPSWTPSIITSVPCEISFFPIVLAGIALLPNWEEINTSPNPSVGIVVMTSPLQPMNSSIRCTVFCSASAIGFKINIFIMNTPIKDIANAATKIRRLLKENKYSPI